LEGTAPTFEEAELKKEDLGRYVAEERRNVFDDEVMDLGRVRMGKKDGQNQATVLQDRSFIEKMKADILRRAEEIEQEEEEDEEEELSQGHASKTRILAYEDEADSVSSEVPVVADGEDSNADGGEEDEDEEEEEIPPPSPETICELAYIRDPKLFERDAQTRRSKARADLKAQTGWTDEQLEGWKIMLERNPKKDKILQKHEFAGNRNANLNVDLRAGGSSVPPPRGGGGSRGRGGRGRGSRGGRGAGGGGGGDTAHDRAWKDKNKASRGNHNRKRGHDKKMARAGGPSA